MRKLQYPIENIASILNQRHSKKSNFALAIFCLLTLAGLFSIALTIYYGLEIGEYPMIRSGAFLLLISFIGLE